MKYKQIAAMLAAAMVTGSGLPAMQVSVTAFAEEAAEEVAVEEAVPAEAPAETAAAEAAPAEAAPAEAAPAEAAPAEAAPMETAEPAVEAVPAEEIAGEAAAVEEEIPEIDEADEADEAGESMELLEDVAEDRAVTESKAETAESKKSKKENTTVEKTEGGTDVDGLIEDNGEVTSVHTGSTVTEILEKEGLLSGAVIAGFTVDPWKYPPVNVTENTQAIYWFLRDELELNHAAACGVLANIQMEANFRPIALGDGGTSYGICQWHLGRFTRLMSYCNAKELDYNTLEGQLEYLKFELENYYPHVLRALEEVADTAKGSYAAAYVFCYHFEIPDQTAARSQQRGNLAQFEYFPEEIERLDEEDLHNILREVQEEDEEETARETLRKFTEESGMVLPEEYQINLFDLTAAKEAAALPAAAELPEETEAAEATEETETSGETETAGETESAEETEAAE